jgi:hypothetical protein
MTYKEILVARSQHFQDSAPQRSAMDYLALRNHEALRAWRVRRVTGGFHTASPTSRAWLPAWLRGDAARSSS